ncbi:MAG: aldo/keto reductase [Acidobacteriaceae bacterium]|nr:aldo/keto reductase [Acidobacteriaceae bacterium]
MEKRKIGSLEVSLAGLGCNNFGWRIDAQATAKVVDAAIDAGINFFDTADIYGKGQSEDYLGKALGGRRNEVIIATKFGMKMEDGKQGARQEYIREAAEASLSRLGTDHIDLYQIHQPDASVPIAETLGALNELVRAGKVREIGCSNFSAEQLRDAAAAPGAAKFVSVQNQYSLIHRDPEKDVLPECVRLRLGFLPYFPLGNGLLTGKYRKGQQTPQDSRAQAGFGPKVFTEENLEFVEALMQFAESRGHTLLELAMSWLAGRPTVASVIAGAKSPEQVRQNAKSVQWKISPEEMSDVDALSVQRTGGVHA